MADHSATPDWHVKQAIYRQWIAEIETPEVAAWTARSGPLISVLMTTWNTPQDWLREAIDSVIAQRYPNWQLCIADDGSSERQVTALLRHYAASDPRIRLDLRTHNGGIAAASNSALGLADGEYVTFLDHDDKLPNHALLGVARHLNEHQHVRLIYSDSDHLDQQGERCRPFFKPRWNPELLLGQNYLNHLCVISTAMVRESGGLRSGFEGAQDYDLYLRLVEQLQPQQIAHIPQVLYHWREAPESKSRSDLAGAAAAGRKAVQEYLARNGLHATVRPAPGALIHNDLVWETPSPLPGLTVYVDPGQLAHWQAHTDYPGAHFLPIAPGACDTFITPASTQLSCIIPPDSTPSTPNWARMMVARICQGQPGSVVCPVRSADRDHLQFCPVVATPTEKNRVSAASYWGSGKGYFASLVLNRQVAAVEGGLLLWHSQLLEENAAGTNMFDRISRACQEHRLPLLWTSQAAPCSHSGSVTSRALNPHFLTIDQDCNFNPNLHWCRLRECH